MSFVKVALSSLRIVESLNGRHLVSKLRGILHLGTPPTLEIPPIETIDSHDHQATSVGNGGQSDGDDYFFNSLQGEITGFYQGALDNVNEGGYCNDENDDCL
jgi:hypothetical protein